MNKHRTIVSNSFILFVGQIVTWTSTLLLTISYGRFLGDFKFGELYFALTFVLLMGIPIQFGYESQIIRSVSKEPDSALAYFSSVFLIKLSIWPIVYSSALLVSWLLGYSGEVRMLVGICGLTLLSSSIASTFASLHYAFERAIFPAVGNILEKGLSALVGILLLSTGAGVQVMALVLLGGSLINGIWQAIWFFRRVGRGFVIDWTLIRTIARTNVPFLLYGVVMVGYDRIDTMLLSVMATSTVVGWYGAAYRLFDTLSFLPNIVRNVLYPISSSSSDADLKGAVEKSINFLLLCGMPIAVGMIVVAPNIVAFLYRRPEFSHTIPALQFLAPGVIFFYVNMALSILLVTKRQDKKIPIIATIALVFTLVLDLLLIPPYQHIGAALVTSLTEVLLFCLNITFIPRSLRPMGSLRVAVKALLASLVMALAILPLHTFNILVILPVAALVYFVAAVLLGTLPREDYQTVYNALRHKVPLPSPVPLANQTNSGQEKRWEDEVGIKPADSHFSLLVPVYNEESCLPSFVRTLLLSDIPLSVDMNIIFITNACNDSSRTLIDEFLAGLGTVEEKPIHSHLHLKDQGLNVNYKTVQQGSITFIHLETRTRGKANALHLGNSIACERGHLIAICVDANNYLEPDAIKVVFAHAHRCFHHSPKAHDTVLLSGTIQAERKTFEGLHLPFKVNSRGQHLVENGPIVDGCFMAWNTEWMYSIDGPPCILVPEFWTGA